MRGPGLASSQLSVFPLGRGCDGGNFVQRDAIRVSTTRKPSDVVWRERGLEEETKTKREAADVVVAVVSHSLLVCVCVCVCFV